MSFFGFTALRVQLPESGPYLLQLTGLPWRQVETGHRSTERGHGRREIPTLKDITIAAGIVCDDGCPAAALVSRTYGRRPGQRSLYLTATRPLGTHAAG